jgi:rhamnose transport system ATP-binding protein
MVLEVRHLSKRFPGVVALDDVSLTLKTGEVHAIVGENGAGKSTLIKTIAGRYRPDAGEILLNGGPVTIADPLKASLMGISVVYQEYNLVPMLTVLDNVLLGREPMTSFGRIDRAAARRTVAELSERMGIMVSPDAYVRDLGAAEAKTVEIMKALAASAEVLILDEPTAALPEKDVASLFRVIRSLRESGVAILYISHRLDEIFAIADRVTVLKDGRLVGTWPVTEINHDFLVRSMVGRELRDVFPARGMRPGAPVVLAGSDLSDGHMLHGVCLEVREGEILGIGGMTGNGQRECIRALFGAHRLRTGSFRFRGLPVRIEGPSEAMKLGLGFIPDDRRNEGLSVTQSVQRNIALPSLQMRQDFGVVRRAEERQTAERVARELELKITSVLQPVSSMSGGNQQRVVIGKWLPLNPKVLLFHEPTLGVDVGAKAEIYRLMRDLSGQGVAIVMVTSDMIELLNVPDRILVFYEGRVAAEFEGTLATEEAVMFAASGGAQPSQAERLCLSANS